MSATKISETKVSATKMSETKSSGATAPETKTPAAAPYASDEAWLAKRHEDAIDPALPILDPHHHLWRREFPYLLEHLMADVSTGHNIRSTVFIECGTMYRTSGDAAMTPVGETEFVIDIVDQAKKQGVKTDVAAGIVGYADLRLGAKVREVLEEQISAGKGRFRGVRNMSVWDDDPDVPRTHRLPGKELLGTKPFREGFAQLAPLNLSFDAWLLHPQIPELAELADAFPDTTIVLDHVGGCVGKGRYANDRKAAFAQWRKNILELGKRQNVRVKVGGMGMPVFGFGFEAQPMPPSSQDLAAVWGPYAETCIEVFGAKRCMFESNFPVDKVSCSYAILWNAFKRIAQGASAAEKAALFHDTAAQTYRL